MCTVDSNCAGTKKGKPSTKAEIYMYVDDMPPGCPPGLYRVYNEQMNKQTTREREVHVSFLRGGGFC